AASSQSSGSARRESCAHSCRAVAAAATTSSSTPGSPTIGEGCGKNAFANVCCAASAAFSNDDETRKLPLAGASSSGRRCLRRQGGSATSPNPFPQPSLRPDQGGSRLRVLLVDDDAPLRTLLRTTLAAVAVDVEEADSAAAALARIRARLPDVVVLDVHMPGTNGLELCAQLKRNARTGGVQVVLLTGGSTRESDAQTAGADAYLRKPFSPLELLGVVDRLAGRAHGVPFRPAPAADEPADALLLYADDLRHVLEIERSQRAALQAAYLETVTALANALDTKDSGTGAHSQRVQRYALALARRVDARLLDDPSLEYGFLLHDVGKIGISDAILQKPGPLTVEE